MSSHWSTSSSEFISLSNMPLRIYQSASGRQIVANRSIWVFVWALLVSKERYMAWYVTVISEHKSPIWRPCALESTCRCPQELLKWVLGVMDHIWMIFICSNRISCLVTWISRPKLTAFYVFLQSQTLKDHWEIISFRTYRAESAPSRHIPGLRSAQTFP